MDPLEILRRTAGQNDPGALVARGLALALLDELDDAISTLEEARRKFLAQKEALSAARCRAALVEIQVFRRSLDGALPALAEVEAELRSLGDRTNAAWMRLLAARLLVLLGRGAEALTSLEALGEDVELPRQMRAVALLVAGEQALRSRRAALASDLFTGAADLAKGQHAVLEAEVERAREALCTPVATWRTGDTVKWINAVELEAMTAPRVFGGPRIWTIDAFRRALVSPEGHITSLRDRPVLFGLLATLAEASPSVVDWQILSRAAFEAKKPNESHRSRLKVELGRLRKLLPVGLSIQSAGKGGWSLLVNREWKRPGRRERTPRQSAGGRDSIATVIPSAGERGCEATRALLADGRAWRVAELAIATGTSSRKVQRQLSELASRGEVQRTGSGPKTRWHCPSRSETLATQMLQLGLQTQA